MKRNTLTTAVLAGLTGMAGMVSVSNATGVHVNPEGTGQVLIYPFYTARGGNDTLISIVNTHERGKAVKVRFREALNSREVLDFHLYMSPYDVWTGAVTANDDGGATLFTNDTSCTVPAIGANGVDFLAFDYAQAANKATGFAGTLDGAGTDIERTASGYIEVIEMASMVEGLTTAPSATSPFAPGHIEWAAKHVDGVPRSCAALVSAWTDGAAPPVGGAWLANPGFGLDDPKGGLFGAASIINVDGGTMFSYNAVALENFWGAGDDAANNHELPGFDKPNLASTSNTTSHVLFGGTMVDQTFDFGIQAVTAALAQQKISNEYVTETDVGAQTEWVLTFPTKSYHVDPYQQTAGHGGAAGDGVVPPFTSPWAYTPATGTLTAACESFNIRFWDREEDSGASASVTEPQFSPQPADPLVRPGFTLCSEANVVAFSDSGTEVEVDDTSGILAEPSRDSGLGFVNVGLPFDSGWAEIDMVTAVTAGTGGTVTTPGKRISTIANPQDTLQTDPTAVIEGLPVVGFAVTTFTNGELESGALSNYGGTFNHRGSRSITSS